MTLDQKQADYYAARAKKAAQLADIAKDPAIAAIHRSMSQSYLELAATHNNVVPTTIDKRR